MEPAQTSSRFSRDGLVWTSGVVLVVVLLKFAEGCLFYFGRNGVKSGVSPMDFIWFRYVFSNVLLHGILSVQMGGFTWRHLPDSRDLGAFLVYGCCHAYFGQYCLFISFQYTPAVVATVWSNLSPVFVCIVGISMGVEVLSRQRYSAHLKLGGAAIGILGAMIFAWLSWLWSGTGGAGEEKHSAPLLGHMWLFVSISGGAVYHVFQKVVLNRGYSSIETVTWGGTIGLIVMSAIVVPQLELKSFDLSSVQWLYVLYAALIPTGLGVWLEAWVVQQTSPLFLTAMNPLTIVISAILGLVVDGKMPSRATLVCSPIVLLGMYVLVLGRARSVATDTGATETSTEETSTDDAQELCDHPVAQGAREQRFA